MAEFSEYSQAVDDQGQSRIGVIQEEAVQVWKSPPPETLKVNVDGAYVGNILRMESIPISGVHSAEFVEAFGSSYGSD